MPVFNQAHGDGFGSIVWKSHENSLHAFKTKHGSSERHMCSCATITKVNPVI